MARHASTAPFTTIALPLDSSAPLYQQLYEEVRCLILSGQLSAGTRLPSTRALADELAVSRGTVVAAFEQLLAEGYIEGRARAGTYVARTLPRETIAAGMPPLGSRVLVQSAAPRILSRRGAAVVGALERGEMWPIASDGAHLEPTTRGAFDTVLPALDAFPYAVWGRLMARRWRKSAPDLLRRWPGAGYGPLRDAIAAYLGGTRGVRCTPRQVIVVDDGRHALELITQVLLDPGDAAWIEDPGYLVPSTLLPDLGIETVAVPVDARGLDVAAGIARHRDARLAVVTPSVQYPLGMTMAASRRLALLEWARRTGAWIFENDCDSQFRYHGRPVAALQGLDTDNRVIYYDDPINVLSPVLGLGYLVVPPDLVDAFVAAHYARGMQTSTLAQAVLADFIAEGHLVRHLHRMRGLYAARLAALVNVARRELAGLLEVRPPVDGMVAIGRLPPSIDDRDAARQAAEYGITVLPLSLFSTQPLWRGGLLLGYAGVDIQELPGAVRRLSVALRALNPAGIVGTATSTPRCENRRLSFENQPSRTKQAHPSRTYDPAVPGACAVDDVTWQRVATLIPPAPSHARGGRPRMPDRQAFDAILYVLRAGITWRDLPRQFGASSTVYGRLREWQRAGLFDAIRQVGLTANSALTCLDRLA